MRDGEGEQRPVHEAAVAVGDQAQQGGGPPGEVPTQRRAHGLRVAHVQALAPVAVDPQAGVDADVVAAVALGDQALAVGQRHHAAVAHQGGEFGVAGVGVVESGLDEGHPGVVGDGVAEEAAHPGPGPVGADDEVGHGVGAVREVEAVGAVAQGDGGGELLPPPHGAGRERVQQQVAQSAPVDLRLVVLFDAGCGVEQDGGVPVQ